LNNDIVAGNKASAGNTGSNNLGTIAGGSFPTPGKAIGGGIEIDSSAAVGIDSYTVANTTNNIGRYTRALPVSANNIYGTYVLLK
jgi:hypothetical protein